MEFKKIKNVNRAFLYYQKLWLKKILPELTLLASVPYRQFNSRKNKLKSKKSKKSKNKKSKTR
jgi:hypothetical protein